MPAVRELMMNLEKEGRENKMNKMKKMSENKQKLEKEEPKGLRQRKNKRSLDLGRGKNHGITRSITITQPIRLYPSENEIP
jgi:hypothetical protein